MLPTISRWGVVAITLALLGGCAVHGDAILFNDDSGAGDGPDAVIGPRDTGPRDTGSLVDARGDTPSTGLDVAALDIATSGDDVLNDVMSVYDTATTTDGCATGTVMTCTAHPDGCAAHETCANGLDDDCNGTVDDRCPCIPGTVQDCFLGPPGRRAVGACRSGTQRCVGVGEFGNWGACEGGISPSAETCDHLDNDCNGCADDGLCCGSDLMCPGPDDMRVPPGRPFETYTLHGGLFYTGVATSWRWTIRGGPCDALLPTPTFTTASLDLRNAAFTPTLSGEYTVTLTVVTADGHTLVCTFVVLIVGPGLRVELCWDTSTTVDLDLYLHDPRNTGPWFNDSTGPNTSVNNNSCNWSNCEAHLRGSMGRSSWGYADSPLAECQNGPLGPGWRANGACSNPRLDIDNNLSKASGVPENINVDNPRDGERFRVMVQNFTGTAAHPILNLYCGGHLRGTIGAAPDSLPDFTGTPGFSSVGAMWHVADVTVHVDAMGHTTGCDVAPLHAPGMTGGYRVTRDNPAY